MFGEVAIELGVDLPDHAFGIDLDASFERVAHGAMNQGCGD